MQLHSYSSMEGVPYCKPHFEQLFKESGNFNKNFQSRINPFVILNLFLKLNSARIFYLSDRAIFCPCSCKTTS